MRKLESYVRKYGTELGTKLHRQLQTKSGVSSAVSRTKKQIAAKLLGAEGGNARAKNLTPARRRAIAKQGAEARWSKRKETQ